MRTLKSRKDRAQLYLNYNGLCAICKTDLTDWHADHKIPYCLTKKTEFDNMQPLCRKCNLEKGARVMSNNLKEYYEQIDLSTCLDISTFRRGQKGAFNCIMETIRKKNTCAIVLPTRYGKSDVIRAACIELVSQGVFAHALIITPGQNLRDQMVWKHKINEMFTRLNIRNFFGYNSTTEFRLPIFGPNDYFNVMTTQMFNLNIQQICDYSKEIQRKTGKPLFLCVDEVHNNSTENSWGNAGLKWLGAGNSAGLFTATPYRENNEQILGFDIKPTGVTEEYKTTKTRINLDDPFKLFLDTYNNKDELYTLNPDYHFTFKEAFAENCLAKLHKHDFDVILELPGTHEKKAISQMSTKEVRGFIGDIVRDEKVIQKGAECLVKCLNHRKSFDKNTQAIIFCGNDLDKQNSDGHANAIKQAVLAENGSYKIVIATNNNKKSNQVIEDFNRGIGDILIVKQMASQGLDNNNLKVALDLSAVRAFNSYVQRITRIATLNAKHEYADFITINDALARILWDELVEKNQGNYRMTEKELIDTKIIDIKDKDYHNEPLVVLYTESGFITDIQGDTISSEDWEIYGIHFKVEDKNYSIKLGKMICESHNVPRDKASEFLARHFKEKLEEKPKPMPINNIEVLKGKRETINQIATSITKKLKLKEPNKTFEEIIIEVYNKTKMHAGINLNVPLNKIVDPNILENMIVFLNHLNRNTQSNM